MDRSLEWANNPLVARKKLEKEYWTTRDVAVKRYIEEILMTSSAGIRQEVVSRTIRHKKGMRNTKKDYVFKGQVYVYSKKFAKIFTSSQEVVAQVIDTLSSSYEVVIVDDGRGVIDSYYKSTYRIIRNTDVVIEGIVIDFSGDPPSNFVRNKRIVLIDVMRTPLLSRDDINLVYGDEIGEYGRCSGIISINGVYPIVYPVAERTLETENIDIRLRDNYKDTDKPLIAAFCRFTKLNEEIIELWVDAVKAADAKLIMAGLNMTTKMKQNMEEKITSLGLDNQSFKILPNMNRSTTMTIISNCRIAFASGPEGGGVSLYEPLFLGVPVIEASWLVVNSIAKHVSWRNKGIMLARNKDEFIKATVKETEKELVEIRREEIKRSFLMYNQQNKDRWMFSLQRILNMARDPQWVNNVIDTGYGMSV